MITITLPEWVFWIIVGMSWANIILQIINFYLRRKLRKLQGMGR